MSTQELPDFIAMWDFGDPAATEARFREVLSLAEASGENLYQLELLTQLARSQGMQGRYKEAHRTLDRVASMLAAGEDPAFRRGRLRFLLERGRVYNSSGFKDEALALFLEAWDLGQDSTEDALTIDAVHMLGIVTSGQDSLDWNLRALALAERTDDPKAAQWQGSLYNNIGWAYMDLGQPEQALELFQKGADFRDAHAHGVVPRRIAHWTVARALRELGRHSEALERLQYIADTFPEHSTDGYWHEELAENRLATGDAAAARQSFAAALPLLEGQGLADSEPERLARIRQLADSHA